MTTPQQPTPPPPHLQLKLPPEQEGGVYANLAAVWHDGDGFILDFSVITGPPQPATREDTGADVTLINAKVVSRVRIPASQAFELMKALNTQLSQWETEHGQTPPNVQA